jgi:putative Mn2+ efflux pump MntP
MNETTGLAVGALFISLAHAFLPTHWLPFVLVGRARKWTKGRIMAVAAIAGLGHVLATIVIGFFIFLLGFKIAEHAGHSVHIISGLFLIGIGVLFCANHFLHHHHHAGPHEKEFVTDKAAILSLFGLLTFSPCEAILPVFLAAGTVGWKTVVPLLAIILVGTVGVMLLLVYLAASGMERIQSKLLETCEYLIVGLILIILGVLVIFAFE